MKINTKHEFICNECGKGHTLKSAERAVYGMGCSNCGGGDIDINPNYGMSPERAKALQTA
jgi:Zn finger protein HypA/HybF involved in hydrogenase expression